MDRLMIMEILGMAGQEVKVAGLATHYIPSYRIPELLRSLARINANESDITTVDRILRSFEVHILARA